MGSPLSLIMAEIVLQEGEEGSRTVVNWNSILS